MMVVSKQGFYDCLYATTSYENDVGPDRTNAFAALVRSWLERLRIPSTANVLELGAGHGNLHRVHPNWKGIEHSGAAVRQGRARYGAIALIQADATSLPFLDNSIDFLYSIATLEHIPGIGGALSELFRVLKPGSYALLAPAWNCRKWTVEKLCQRTYRELAWTQKVSKALIPLRELLVYRMLVAMPARLLRELQLVSGRPLRLHYKRLQPDMRLINHYGHVADDDAFVSIDAHAVLTFYKSQGYKSLTHPNVWRRIACRGEPIVIQKPLRCGQSPAARTKRIN